MPDGEVRAGAERAVLVRLELPGEAGDLGEFRALALSAGVEPLATVRGRLRRPDPRHFLSLGKVEELAACVREHAAEVVLVDHPLSPAQERNLERLLECRVLDRVALILDIFAQRASTFEGKLQVELAQLRHLSTRLVRGWTHLERQKGGIGLRGPGEKQLETDRRLIAERIRRIDERLERVRARRDLSRRARDRAAAPVVALVGYTNAGKSTLFNALTGARVECADRLFATLDPTLRRLELPGGPDAILADTVGFIRHLPHELVAAFRATLEEVRRARLVLHVIDAASPERAARERQVEAVLEEIEAAAVPRIDVWNKIDRLAEGPPGGCALRPVGARPRVQVSARTGAGLEALRRLIAATLRQGLVCRHLHLPASAGRARARLHALGAVLAEQPSAEGGWRMTIEIGRSVLADLARQEGLDAWLEEPGAEPAEPVRVAEAGH